MPCTYCFKNQKQCRFSKKSSRCLKCVHRGRSCDGVLVESTLSRLESQRKKLESEEEKAEDDLLELQQKLAEAVSRLSRIRKIRKRVVAKSDEALERGIAEADAEDGIVPALTAHEQWVTHDLSSLGVPDDFDWSSVGLGEFAGVGPLNVDAVVAGPSETLGSPRNTASSS
ncbi:hypothetical protein LIA77_06576 [Sarocladium implicatum]|nr:hypothetical protein LIA77_06576 [Sarocladium implicatum]